ncbi:MAG: ribosome assembly RNA-binding protein YhbY [Woeseiaceae bacterium]
MKLTEAQQKFLRSRGHALKPLIMIGNAGLSEAVFAEFDSTITHHELIKVKIRGADRDTRDAIITDLCERGAATLVQRVGNVALLYRANPEQNRILLPRR